MLFISYNLIIASGLNGDVSNVYFGYSSLYEVIY